MPFLTIYLVKQEMKTYTLQTGCQYAIYVQVVYTYPWYLRWKAAFDKTANTAALLSASWLHREKRTQIGHTDDVNLLWNKFREDILPSSYVLINYVLNVYFWPQLTQL